MMFEGEHQQFFRIDFYVLSLSFVIYCLILADDSYYLYLILILRWLLPRSNVWNEYD